MGKRLGLRQSVTGLPFVLWLRQGDAAGDPANIYLDASRSYDDPDLCRFMTDPVVLQISGESIPGGSVDLLTHFLSRNSKAIETYWQGQATGDMIKNMIVKVSPRF